MATTAREIGQIFAQQINFRQSIKDRIEDYILKTELAALDPALQRARQAEINRMRDAVDSMDKEIADIIEKKVAGVDNIAQRWVAADGSVKAQQVAAGGRVEAARITTEGDLQEALMRVRADLEKAKAENATEERIAQIEANAKLLEDLRKEEAKGEAGAEQNLSKVIEDAQTFAGSDRFQLEAKYGDLWNREYKAKFDALAGNPIGQRRLVEKFAEASDTFIKSIGSESGRSAILDELSNENMSAAEVALRGAGLPEGYLAADKATLVMDEASKRGYTEPRDSYVINYLPSGKGTGVDARPPVGRPIEPASRAALLGLQSNDQVKDFEERAAFNRYLLDTVGPRGEVSTKTFEEFKTEASDPKSDAASRISEARISAPQELAQFGDRSLVDLMLKRKGALVELADVKNAFAESGSEFPSYQSVQRKTLESYSELYGGRGQQRLVNLAEFGRKTPITITDPTTGEERQVQLDAPELEVLFGGGITGRGGGGAAISPVPKETRRSTVAMGLDQNLIGQSTGMPSTRATATLTAPLPSPRIVEEPEAPLALDLTARTPEERGMTGRLPAFGVEQPAAIRREAVPGETRRPTFGFGEPETFADAAQMATATPPTDATRFKAAPLVQALLEAPAPVPPAPKAEKALEDMSEFELEGELKNAIEKSKRLQAELQMADPTRAAQIQDELKALGERARQILITSKSVPITKEDFDTLTPDELTAKVQPKTEVKPVTLSAQSQRSNKDLVTFAEGSTAASKAQKQIDAGKEATPVKFIKGADKLSEGQVATIKNLAQKRGSVRAGDLTKTLAQIIGVDESSPLVEKAKSLYIAFEQLA